jgi:hypothetical protein
MHAPWESWLVAACDPVTPTQASPGALATADMNAALETARSHAVLGAALNSARAWGLADRPEHAHAVRHHAGDHLRDVGRTLGLRHVAQQATRKLVAAGITCCILKGEDFAARLYPTQGLRPYRDVDVLVPRAAYREADRIVQSLGFKPVTPDRKYAAAEYGQISYFALGPEKWSFELHWNLINSPAQRRLCSLAWEDLEFEPPSAARAGEAYLLTPNSLLVLASVHACVGHRFDSLQQLCDLRQICRGAAGTVDATEVVELCRHLRCETPLAWSLDLLVRVFNCGAARELRSQCDFSRRVVRPWGILGRQTVMQPNAPVSKLRRSLARIRLKDAA